MSWTALFVILLVSFILLVASAAGNNSSGFAEFCGGIFLSTVIAICIKIDSPIEPIEVYQGKTELEYTIRGGEVVDSIVVYKKK